MGAGQCCSEKNKLKDNEQDLSSQKKSFSDSKARSAEFAYSKSFSKGSKCSKNPSRKNLQIKLLEIGLEHDSKINLSIPGELSGRDAKRISSNPELFAIQRSSQEFSNLPDSPGNPSSPHQTNYIVVVEADENMQQDSDDNSMSKSRSLFCKSIEKDIEDKAFNMPASRPNQLGLEDGQRHDYLFSKNTIIQKQEKSIMQSRYQLDYTNNDQTIEYSMAAGKTKDKLFVTDASQLINLDRLAEFKFVKAIIELDDFTDNMTKKFINATSVIHSNYIKLNLTL